MKRGDIVIVVIPYVDGRGGKKRPALVVQNDRDNRRLTNTVVAMISGNLGHADEATQFFIDPATAKGTSSGLHGPSVVKCCNLFTVAQVDVGRTIGQLSDAMMNEVEGCLMAALGIRDKQRLPSR